MNSTKMIVAFLGYLAIHFLIYVVVFRQTRLFRSERAIFLYHFIPAAIMALAVSGLPIVFSPEDMLASAVLVLSLQGIYSLSFLELWSLAQGSYSLSILLAVNTAAQEGKDPDFAILEHIGARKRASRLEGLQRLGLIQPCEGIYRLTRVGLIIATFLRLIARLVDLKKTGQEMWMMWAVGYFVMAVAAHGCIPRLVWWKDPVSNFLLVGSLLGLMLIGHMSVVYGFALPTFASIAFYAFACELYMFLFTLVMSSVSAKLLMTLRHTFVSDTDMDEMYSTDGMVERRLERLLGVRLLNRDGGQWKLSPKGLRLMRAFVALKRFFDHPIQ